MLLQQHPLQRSSPIPISPPTMQTICQSSRHSSLKICFGLGKKRMPNGVMVKSIFAKITDAKRFLYFLMIKNTPAERKSPWDNHKSLRSFSSISTSCSSSHSSKTSSAAETFVVIPGTFPFSWSVFYHKKQKNRLGSVIFAKIVLTITPYYNSMVKLEDKR